MAVGGSTPLDPSAGVGLQLTDDKKRPSDLQQSMMQEPTQVPQALSLDIKTTPASLPLGGDETGPQVVSFAMDDDTPVHSGDEDGTSAVARLSVAAQRAEKERTPGGLDSWYDGDGVEEEKILLEQNKQKREQASSMQRQPLMSGAGGNLEPATSSSSNISASAPGPFSFSGTTSSSSSLRNSEIPHGDQQIEKEQPETHNLDDREDAFHNILPVGKIWSGAQAAKSFFSWAVTESDVAKQVSEGAADVAKSVSQQAGKVQEDWMKSNMRAGLAETSTVMTEGLKEIQNDFQTVAQEVSSSSAVLTETLAPSIEASKAGLRKFASGAASAAIWFQSMGRVNPDTSDDEFGPVGGSRKHVGSAGGSGENWISAESSQGVAGGNGPTSAGSDVQAVVAASAASAGPGAVANDAPPTQDRGMLFDHGEPL